MRYTYLAYTTYEPCVTHIFTRVSALTHIHTSTPHTFTHTHTYETCITHTFTCIRLPISSESSSRIAYTHWQPGPAGFEPHKESLFFLHLLLLLPTRLPAPSPPPHPLGPKSAAPGAAAAPSAWASLPGPLSRRASHYFISKNPQRNPSPPTTESKNTADSH